MRIIGTSDGGFIATVTLEEVAKIIGFRHSYDAVRANIKIEPGMTINVSDIYESTMAVRNLAGSLDYAGKQGRAAFEAALSAADNISKAVLPPDPPLPKVV